MKYRWFQVTQWARLFGDNFPSWISLSKGEKSRVELYRQILESDQVSVCHEASCVNLAYLTFFRHLNRPKPISWKRSSASLKPKNSHLNRRKRSWWRTFKATRPYRSLLSPVTSSRSSREAAKRVFPAELWTPMTTIDLLLVRDVHRYLRVRPPRKRADDGLRDSSGRRGRVET